jgi:hypothetical protein
MAKSHAVRTLEKKRADLKADLAHLSMLREKTLVGLAHVEATLAILREAKQRGAPSGYQRRWLFRRGELKRLILAVEREAAGPLTHREVARAIIARMGWDREDRELLRIMAEKVKASRRSPSAQRIRPLQLHCAE